ncbi:MAG: hypothetical protein GY714_08685 [Desulfobacterales bacterium]|nr:hypothetical protein [Desulfobacterales bacterium]MCP4161336.1 hypothetical protein [Deltaproteobacteria bacterium]
MNNQKAIKTLYRIGVLSSIIFPATLIVSFIIHHMGEYSMADMIKLKLIYIPPSPERFMELFSSNSNLDFIIPHLIIYLAIPFGISAVIYFGYLLFEKKPWLSIIGTSLSITGIVFMGGVFGSWLSFTAIGNINAELVPGVIDVIEELTKKQGMLLLSSLLAGLSLLGFMIIAAGLFYTKVIPRWQSAFIFAGNAIIIFFMDIDNLMLVGSILWFTGALPFLKIPNTIRYQRTTGKSGTVLAQE